jgi:predicted N-acyltransferase
MRKAESSGVYLTRLVADLGTIDAADWDALLHASAAAGQTEAPPFLRHAFLHALQTSASVGGRSGWTPAFLTLWQDERLAGAVPLYRKDHSYGEYVFDWAWAEAYGRHGLAYYPKWLAAVPFTPVPGPRLLAQDDDARHALVQALLAQAQASGYSSLHVLFPTEIEGAALQAAGFSLRHSVQFHWRNRGYAGFEDYLAALTQPKRKKIRAERRRVAEAGVTHRILTGREARDEDWRFFYACYARTYFEHRSSPYLSEAFFSLLAQAMPEALVLFIAERAGRPIAASLLLRSATRLYGRYWGALEHVPLLHFETAYYQPIEWAIAQGIAVFEGGAQGEHKMARGFLPVRTLSAHWLAHPEFADAVQRFLDRETGGVEAYLDELNERSPMKAAISPDSP